MAHRSKTPKVTERAVRRGFSFHPTEAGLVLLVFLAPLFLIPSLYDYSELAKAALIEIGAVSLALVWLLEERRGPALRPTGFLPIPHLLLAALLWAGISVLWATSYYDGVTRWVNWAACALIFLIARDQFRRDRIMQVLWTLLGSGVIIAVLVFAQNVWEYKGIVQSVAPAATLANKNLAGEYLMMVLPLTAYFFLRAQKTSVTWIAALSGAVVAVGLVHTTCKAALLGATAQAILLLGAWLWLRRAPVDRLAWGKAKWHALPVAALVFVIGILVGPGGFSFQTLGKYNQVVSVAESLGTAREQMFTQDAQAAAPEKANSLTIRTPVWRNTIEMIREHPVLGVGLGNFGTFYPRYVASAAVDLAFNSENQWQTSHNDYLQFTSEMGMVGFLFFLAAALAVLWKAWSSWRSSLTVERRLLVCAAVASLLGLAIDAFFAFPFQTAILPFLAVLLVALVDASTEWQKQPQPAPGSSKVLLRPRDPSYSWAVGFVCLLLLGLLFAEYNRLVSDWYFNRVQAAFYRAQPDLVAENAKIGLEYNPWDIKHEFSLARALMIRGEYEEGFQRSLKVLSRKPYYVNALHNHALGLIQKGDLDEAMKYLERVLSIKPDYGLSLVALAQIHGLKGDKQTELKLLRDALGAETRDTTNLQAYVKLAMELEANDDAEKGLRRLIELDSKRGRWHLLLGIVYLRQKRYEPAIEAMKRAVELDPLDLEARFRLGGVLYVNLDRKEEGAEHLKKIIQLNPRHRYAATAAKILQSGRASRRTGSSPGKVSQLDNHRQMESAN